MTGVPQARRKHHKSPEDEMDASLLNLGPEFQNCQCLALGEVQHLLEERENVLKALGIVPSSTFVKCKAYASLFSRLHNRQAISSLKSSFSSSHYINANNNNTNNNANNTANNNNANNGNGDGIGLEPFEIASLINLCPESVDEVRALLPSLRDRVSEQAVQQVVEELGTTLRLQE